MDKKSKSRTEDKLQAALDELAANYLLEKRGSDAYCKIGMAIGNVFAALNLIGGIDGE